MALQAPVISLSGHVTETQKNLYNITFRMVCTDDAVGFDGLDVTYSIKYRPGDGAGDKVVEATAFFQEKIDSYQSAAVIENHATMTAALTAIQNGLVI